MSKSAADIAMVGIALGPAAIAGVGLATPYWAIAFAIGGGIAGATIGLVSQRYSGGRRKASRWRSRRAASSSSHCCFRSPRCTVRFPSD